MRGRDDFRTPAQGAEGSDEGKKLRSGTKNRNHGITSLWSEYSTVYAFGGFPVIYFDNAATGGTKPDEVLLAVKSVLAQCANPGRSGHRLSVSMAERVFLTRSRLSSYFGGYGADRVVFTKNCTEALNIAIFSLQGHIVTTALEHNSVLRPLSARGNYTVCPLKEGKIDPEELVALVRPDTQALVISLASNVTGYAPNIRAIRALLPKDVLLVCDGAQYGGHLPLSMKQLGIDALALAGHKGINGIQGSGVLLFSHRFSPPPRLFGGTGTESNRLDMPDCYPERLEAGTLNYPAIVSLHEGILALQTNGEHDMTRMTKYLHAALSRLPLILYSSPNPFGILSFASEKRSSEEIAAILSADFDIATRGGLHCAPLIHKAIDRTEGGSLRVSLGYQNTYREMDQFLCALRKILP